MRKRTKNVIDNKRSGINWDRWNDIEGFFRAHVLMSGEEKTLTDEEVNDLNETLSTISNSTARAEELILSARARWLKESEK